MSQSRILIFCGKGGVGKTTLSLAVGLHHAAQDRKVVVVTSHPIKELAMAVSLEGIHERFPVAAKNLFVVHIDPKELLAEVVRSNFPVEWVANRVLDSRIYQNLIEVAPGLKEFYFLARLQALAERAVEGHPDFELLLWDAPATGHFISTLHSARNFETFLTGPLAEAGAKLARFFSQAANIAVFPTTTLEEMAIEETVELCHRLESEFQLRVTRLLLNLVSPLAGASDEEVSIIRDAARAGDPALKFAADRALIERERAAWVAEKVAAPVLSVERVRAWSNDLDLLAQLGTTVGKLPLPEAA